MPDDNSSEEIPAKVAEIIGPEQQPPSISLPPGVPLGLAVLAAAKYWGITRAFNRYSAAIAAERRAFNELTLRAQAQEGFAIAGRRLEHLPDILEAERLKIQDELKIARERRNATDLRLREEKAVQTLRTLRAEDQLKDYKKNRTGEKPAFVPFKEEIDKMMAHAKSKQYAEEVIKAHIAQCGGEDKLTPGDHEFIEQMRNNVEALVTLEGR